MAHFDLVVIGSGPAGEKGAAQAAYFGKRVAVVEREPVVGGAAANTGTLPSKTLRETALYLTGLRQRGLYGVEYRLERAATVEDFLRRSRKVAQAERDRVRRNLERHGITLVEGTARFLDHRTVAVQPSSGHAARLTADVFLVATGSSPRRPGDYPWDDPRLLDSDTVLRLGRIPDSLVVVGGGVIGCEYACVFAALGVSVSLVEGRDVLLPFLDREISEALRRRMEFLGVRPVLGERVAAVDPADPREVILRLASGAEVRAEAVLVAAGRAGNTASLGLEELGIRVGPRGHAEVDERYRTAVPNIYAAGDVVGFPALGSTSMEQARVAMVHAFDLRYKTALPAVLPYGIYTIPEISAAGETEESLRQQGVDYVAGRARYADNARGRIIGDGGGMLKLLFARADSRLLGVHVIGEGATELVHVGLTGLMTGATADLFVQTCFNYPTLSELYKYATYDGLGRRRS